MENQAQNTDFGMNQEDIKNYKLKSFWNTIKYYLAKIEPAFVKIFQTILYWTIKFSKAFFSGLFRMILGKEV